MRVRKHFAEGEPSDKEKNILGSKLSNKKEVKQALSECRALICQLHH